MNGLTILALAFGIVVLANLVAMLPRIRRPTRRPPDGVLCDPLVDDRPRLGRDQFVARRRR